MNSVEPVMSHPLTALDFVVDIQMPITVPITSAMAKEMRPSLSVTGKPCAIRSFTVTPVRV